MKITRDIYLDEFEFWAGAVDNAEKLTNDEMTETEVNDMMWFDFGYVCELLGLEYEENSDTIIREEGDRNEE